MCIYQYIVVYYAGLFWTASRQDWIYYQQSYPNLSISVCLINCSLGSCHLTTIPVQHSLIKYKNTLCAGLFSVKLCSFWPKKEYLICFAINWFTTTEMPAEIVDAARMKDKNWGLFFQWNIKTNTEVEIKLLALTTATVMEYNFITCARHEEIIMWEMRYGSTDS